MGFFKKPTLRTRDDQRTSAAELTLRASILPLCLVTILFFLWVRHIPYQTTSLTRPGLLIRPHRHAEQALPSRAQHHARTLLRTASSLLRRVPACFAGPCELAAQTLGIQDRVYLGSVSVRHRRAADLAVSCVPLVRRVLRGDFCHREWFGQSRDGCESVP